MKNISMKSRILNALAMMDARTFWLVICAAWIFLQQETVGIQQKQIGERSAVTLQTGMLLFHHQVTSLRKKFPPLIRKSKTWLLGDCPSHYARLWTTIRCWDLNLVKNFRQRQLQLRQQQRPQRLRPRRRQRHQLNQPTSAVQQACPIQQHSNLFWPLFHLSYCFSHFKCCQSVAKLFCAIACSL